MNECVCEMSSSDKNCENENRKLQSLDASVSCDNMKANSCIELDDIRKLDSLLNQCESISCDNLLLVDDIYNYDLCRTNRRKYASMSAINRILPKNSIRRRAHKIILGIRESDTKIINFLDGVRNCTSSETDANVVAIFPAIDLKVSANQMSQNFFSSNHTNVAQNWRNCCDKNIQTSHINLNTCTKSFSAIVATKATESEKSHKLSKATCTTTTSSSTMVTRCLCGNNKNSSDAKMASPKNEPDYYQKHHQQFYKNHYLEQQQQMSHRKEKKKQCTCRDYENVNTICETSLSITPVPTTQSFRPTSAAVSIRQKNLRDVIAKEKSEEKPTSGKYNRLIKQRNTIIDDEGKNEVNDDDGGIIIGCNIDSSIAGYKNGNVDGCLENRVINVNKSVDIIPISLNSPYCSRAVTPHLGTNTNSHHDAKSDKSETISQKSKRSKFSPSFITRKLMSRLNSNEIDDGVSGAKESLLGRAKSAEKKLPDPVETVCILTIYYFDIKLYKSLKHH